MKLLAIAILVATTFAAAVVIAQHAACAKPKRLPQQINDVRSGTRTIGRDPDPFIRGEMLRHYHSGWPD